MSLVELPGLSEESRKNYEVRLNKLQQLTGKRLEYILCHPRETLQVLQPRQAPSTIANYATVLCKVFSSNTELSTKYEKSYTKWKEILKTHTITPLKTEPNAYKSMYEKLKTTHNVPHMQYLFVSLLAHIPQLKRSDVKYFGNMLTHPQNEHQNHVNLVNTDPYIFINNTKIYINQQLYEDITSSLKKQPRQYLFTNKQNQPYTKANSFNQFIKRLKGRLFI